MKLIRNDVTRSIYCIEDENEEMMKFYDEEYYKWYEQFKADWNIKRENKLTKEI